MTFGIEADHGRSQAPPGQRPGHILVLRRDVTALLDPADTRRKVLGERGPHDLGSLSDLPNNAILDRGRIVGLWDFDPETQSIAWWPFVPKDKALQEAVERTAAFVRDELGDARSFSLDSPKSRAPRIAALRKAASLGGRPSIP